MWSHADQGSGSCKSKAASSLCPFKSSLTSSFHRDIGMSKGPKMSGSDKSKKRQDVLAAFAAKGQRISGKLRLCWVQLGTNRKRFATCSWNEV